VVKPRKNPFKPCPMCASRKIRMLDYKEHGLMVQCEVCDLRLIVVCTIKDALGQAAMIRGWNHRRKPEFDPADDYREWNYTSNALIRRYGGKPIRKKKVPSEAHGG
jgi:hypothetical protein